MWSRVVFGLSAGAAKVCLTDKALLKPALFIPNTLSLFEVLEMFKSTGADFAVIVNEYALVVGVITLKDVMSIVMGELVTLEEQPIVQRTDNSWLIDGMTPIEDVIRSLGIVNLPNSQNYETISGFMMFMLRKIPKKPIQSNMPIIASKLLPQITLKLLSCWSPSLKILFNKHRLIVTKRYILFYQLNISKHARQILPYQPAP